MQDTAMRSGKATHVFGTLVLVLLGVASLAGITFVLSRFITEPARRVLEREKQFVSAAGHELKTPIGAISINAQALAMDSDDVHLRNILSETDQPQENRAGVEPKRAYRKSAISCDRYADCRNREKSYGLDC